MTQQKPARIFEHPLAFGSFRNWLRLLWNNKDIDRKFIPRALFVCFSTFLTSPLRLYESVRYGRIVKNTAIHRSPIFIVGHWRTGTTHLHNLLCQDKNLGYVSTFQAFAPGLCLVGEKVIKRLFDKIAKKLHPTREIDNIPLSMDNPEEEDLAIASMSPYSYLHMYTFPRQARYFFERYTFGFNNLPESTLAEWKEIYLTIMRKATLQAGGKRLVIKNCADSGRIKTLLDLFPDAKFIHIYRNPYHVFRSTLFLYRVVLERSQLQEISPDEIEAWVSWFYTQLMQRFLADKALIPAGNLVEVKYEDLEAAPLDQLRRVYETLSLPGF
ncbi:MAG: sulfotransferase, partial [Dehalococcoidia bacterium]